MKRKVIPSKAHRDHGHDLNRPHSDVACVMYWLHKIIRCLNTILKPCCITISDFGLQFISIEHNRNEIAVELLKYMLVAKPIINQ